MYSVLVNTAYVRMIHSESGSVKQHRDIPQSYKGRVKIEGRATLVIKNVNPGDNTEFKCELSGTFLGSIVSTVKLIVRGTYFRHNHWESYINQMHATHVS